MITASSIREYAEQTLNFDLCRFTTPVLSTDTQTRRKSWLEHGYAGEMEWLLRHERFKQNPGELLDNAQSAIVLAVSYLNTRQKRLMGPYKIARYALGLDYHDVIAARMKQLETFIVEQSPETNCYWGVDSRPIAERELAEQSGIGFQGRNTMIIRPGMGSYFFLAVMFTTLKIDQDRPISVNCGTCRRCLDACPTGALLEDNTMDARLCISYQTIEKKSPLTEAEAAGTEGWLFGCDICQEVCPFNKDNIPLSTWEEFHPDQGIGDHFFTTDGEFSVDDINEKTPLYRSRKRLIPNFETMKRLENSS